MHPLFVCLSHSERCKITFIDLIAGVFLFMFNAIWMANENPWVGRMGIIGGFGVSGVGGLVRQA